jgi:hypothetical protein
MTKLKSGIIAGALALITQAVILSVLLAEGVGSRICAVLYWPPMFFGALIGLLGEFLGFGFQIGSLLTPIFGFLWFFLIYWAIFTRKYGRPAA